MLPTGTVTFLLTDIEGSTGLWQDHLEEMASALTHHDRILASAIENFDGRLVKNTGDGVFAVFATAPQALEAAAEAQAGLVAQEFPGVGVLKTRMAVHTGEAEEREGDYFGLAPSRSARLLAVGHGGQVLISAATREVLGDTRFEFLDLGEHRLRDLARPEHIYQLLCDGIPVEFPPLTSVDTHPNNLPVQLTSFVGRETEVRLVADLLREARLVTLTGVGGTGKTRLLLRVAAEVASSYADGVWLVELSPVTDPTAVVGQAAEPFGVRAMKTGRSLIDVLADYLAEKQLLLLLDNCEHVVEASGAMAEELLTRCASLQVIATSRELLGIPGEVVHRVPPLSVSDPDSSRPDGSEAVRLFAERAAQVNPGFRLHHNNLPTVQALARRLDGLPLAIELAASRANLLTPEQILERIDQRFQVMTAARRDRGRHTTLVTAMDWSYDIITPTEQSAFRQMAVFTGGWTLDAAEAVCAVPNADPFHLLGRLVDQSLVDVLSTNGGNRYRLLEPVREYASMKLRDSGEEQLVRRRHARHFADLAEASDIGLKGPDQNAWVRQIELEHDNLRAAITWSIDSGEDELALRLGAGLAWFWWVRGYWREAMDWFNKIYAATPDADPVLRGRLVYKLAGIEVQRARPAEVKPLFEEYVPVLRELGTEADLGWILIRLADSSSADTGRELSTRAKAHFAAAGDVWGEAYASWGLGWCLWVDDQLRGLASMRPVIDELVSLGDRWTAGWFAFNLGYLMAHGGWLDEGRRVIEETLELVAGTYDRWISAHCRHRLGVISTMTGSHQEALRLFEEALPVHRKIGDENCTATAQIYLGEIFTDMGRFGEARENLVAALKGARELQNPSILAAGLRRIAWLQTAREDCDRAARSLGASERIREQLDQKAVSVHDARRLAEVEDMLVEVLGRERFESLRAAGSEMTTDEAIEVGLQA